MKKRISVLLFTALCIVPTISFSSPYVVTGKFNTAYVSTCVFTLNDNSAVELPPVGLDSISSVCKYDVKDSRNGSNIVSVQYKNIWGASSSVPFSYEKALPPTPSDMTLSE